MAVTLLGTLIRVDNMVAGYSLPLPSPLEIHDANASDKWKKFYRAWSNYVIATELNKKSEAVQVATLLTVIGEEAREVFTTIRWQDEAHQAKIGKVVDKFKAYCQPWKNIPCDRILENLPFWHKQTFLENSNENFNKFLKINFLHIWIKQLLNLLAVKFHTHSFFFLGDMDDYIRPCSNFTCMG